MYGRPGSRRVHVCSQREPSAQVPFEPTGLSDKTEAVDQSVVLEPLQDPCGPHAAFMIRPGRADVEPPPTRTSSLCLGSLNSGLISEKRGVHGSVRDLLNQPIERDTCDVLGRASACEFGEGDPRRDPKAGPAGTEDRVSSWCVRRPGESNRVSHGRRPEGGLQRCLSASRSIPPSTARRYGSPRRWSGHDELEPPGLIARGLHVQPPHRTRSAAPSRSHASGAQAPPAAAARPVSRWGGR